MKNLEKINSVGDWLELANKGNAQAQYIIATLYECGTNNFAQDYKQAVKWFRRAAYNKNANAMLVLCFYYFKGDVIARDEDKGMYWLKKAAQYGNAEAQMIMAGRNPYEKKVPSEQELAHCCAMAEAGDSESLYKIGYYYLHGLGVKKNAETAVQYFMKSAEQGCTGAMLDLSCCMLDGIGIDKDPDTAADWFAKAASGGNPVALQYFRVMEDKK